MENTLLAWHFCRDDMRLAFNDGRQIVPGETLSVTGLIEVARRGLHACVWAKDALKYKSSQIIHQEEVPREIDRNGPIHALNHISSCAVCRVKLSGEIDQDGVIHAASHRKVLWCVIPPKEFWAAIAQFAAQHAKKSALDAAYTTPTVSAACTAAYIASRYTCAARAAADAANAVDATAAFYARYAVGYAADASGASDVNGYASFAQDFETFFTQEIEKCREYLSKQSV